MAPRSKVPKPTKQERAKLRETQAAAAESRIRYDHALNQLKNANYPQALQALKKVRTLFCYFASLAAAVISFNQFSNHKNKDFDYF